jgi:hypothetical protein
MRDRGKSRKIKNWTITSLFAGAIAALIAPDVALAQDGLSDAKRAQIASAFTALNVAERQLDAALASGAPAEIARLSRSIDEASSQGAFIAGIGKNSPAYAVLWNCESALSKLGLMAVLAEGLARKLPGATIDDFKQAASEFPTFSSSCKTGLGETSPVILTPQRAEAFVQKLQ